MWLINLNKPDIINRIELPRNILEVVDAEITDAYKLFIMCQGRDGYRLLRVDLNSYDDMIEQNYQYFQIETILEFSKRDVHQVLEQSSIIH